MEENLLPFTHSTIRMCVGKSLSTFAYTGKFCVSVPVFELPYCTITCIKLQISLLLFFIISSVFMVLSYKMILRVLYDNVLLLSVLF